jgi:hypothetical protein
MLIAHSARRPILFASLRNFRSFTFARRTAVGVILGYVAVCLTLGGTPAAKPVFHVVAAAWVLLLAAWSVCRRAPEPIRHGRLGRVADLVATNLALTLALAEFSLRAFAALAGTSLVVSDTLDSHRLMPGRDYGGGLRGNSLGYPGRDSRREKQPGIFRIAALGDSFAVGPAVPFAENYLTLLEKQLPHVEVYNFGVSGAGPREYREILRRDVWTYQPDLVLLSVFVGNDITEVLATPRHMDPRQLSLYLLLTRGWRLVSEQWRQADTMAGAGSHHLPARGLAPGTFREVEARRLAICRLPVTAAMERKWRRALADLEGIVSDCRARGKPFAVVLIPDEFQVNPAVLRMAANEANVEPSSRDLEYPQRRLAAFFAQSGVPCLDLRPEFAGVPATYAPRDTHWNERGNRLAATHITRWLQRMIRGGENSLLLDNEISERRP